MTDTNANLDVWAASLDVADEEVDMYRATLDNRELARVDRLRRDIDKRHYIVSHGMLRAILARYAAINPAHVEFRYGPFGKPYIDLPPAPSFRGGAIEFNMSDSGGMLLVAVTRGVAVGVDIEQRRSIEIMKFARRFFMETEAAALEALPEVEREAAFFRTWTCKESYVKGWGYGIQRHVGKFEVRVGHRLSGLVSCPFADDSPSRWSLVDIAAIPGFAATVAIEQPGVEEVAVRWWGVANDRKVNIDSQDG